MKTIDPPPRQTAEKMQNYAEQLRLEIARREKQGLPTDGLREMAREFEARGNVKNQAREPRVPNTTQTP